MLWRLRRHFQINLERLFICNISVDSKNLPLSRRRVAFRIEKQDDQRPPMIMFSLWDPWLDTKEPIIDFIFLTCQHCNPLQGKYRFFTGNSLCSISTLTCFGSVQGLKGKNFIEIQGNICILYRNIALDSYIHVYVLITGISLLFEKQQHRILEKQGKSCK